MRALPSPPAGEGGPRVGEGRMREVRMEEDGRVPSSQPMSASAHADLVLVAVRAGGRVLCRGTATLVLVFVAVP